MIDIHAEIEGIDEATRLAAALPGRFNRARASAMKSMGWWIRGELRNHVEYGGSGWPALHPMSMKFRKKRNTGGGRGTWDIAWANRRRGRHHTPIFWLGKFARYQVDPDGEVLTLGFGRTSDVIGERRDPIARAAMRAEQGQTIRVTEKMRRFFGATRRKRPKKQIPGKTYFPLRRETRILKVPPRPIIRPVRKKIEPRVPAYFTKKFWSAFERYTSGGRKR